MTVELPAGYDEQAVRREANRHRIALYTQSDYGRGSEEGGTTLMLGYAQSPEPTIDAGVRELAGALQAAVREA